jgi:glycerol-1-phosphate dehydrogenase [NAD(P)+]
VPYAVFGTAPSMNGYTSVSAAITVEGHKKSLPATAAAGVFLDLETLSAAPARLIQAGFGDSVCRSTAQTDWLMAHLLLDQPYRRVPFQLLLEDEETLFAKAADLLHGDLDAMECLARTLVLSGFGMTICGGSYPASQGEHLISHYIEMIGDPALPSAYHGEQVAVTTLTMARLQERMLRGPAPALRASSVTETDLIRHFGPELGHHCWHNFKDKILDSARAIALSGRLAAEWPVMTAALREVARPPQQIAEALRAVGAPRTPTDFGLPAAFYRQAVLHAREIRDRFTFLDLAAESGRLDPA